jgi:hypothetical protein
VTTEVRYFIGSRAAGADVYGEALRGHGGIENNQSECRSSAGLCAAADC